MLPKGIFGVNFKIRDKSQIFEIFDFANMAAILNFISRFFSKSNQIVRTLYYTYILSFMKIRPTVPEIEHPQTISN